MTPKARSNYKDVWNDLSGTEHEARLYVIGDADEETIHATAEETKRWLAQSVGLQPTDVILEIGCGIGRVGQVLAPDCREWIGCDVSRNMLEHARERLASFDNVRFVELSGFDLRPIEDASVDLVYCTVVFMHLDEWERYNYILEALRILRPGGHIFVDNFNLRSDEGWGIFEQHWQMPPHARPSHTSRSSTPHELEALLKRAGFEDIHINETGAWVQGYGTRPAGSTATGGLIYPEPVPPPTEPGPTSISSALNENKSQKLQTEYDGYIQQLEATIAKKDAHIQHLERLLTRVENGRLLRILHWMKATVPPKK